MARLSKKQIQAIHAKRWNSPSTTEDQRKAVLTSVGFGHTSHTPSPRPLTPLLKRKYKDLPFEVRDQLVLKEQDRGV